jgi:hypothetical protein
MIRWMCLVVAVCTLYVSSAGAVIVDLNARSNNLSNTIDLALGAGTYAIDPIGTADGGAWNAWNAWGRTSCANSTGCPRTSPTTVVGWLNIYSFGSADLTNVTINGIAAVPSVGDNYFVDPFMAYPDPLSALADAWSAEFTLAVASMVSFAIPDNPLSDNLGGMSLNVTVSRPSGSVPEPASIALMGLGLLGLAAARYRKRT